MTRLFKMLLSLGVVAGVVLAAAPASASMVDGNGVGFALPGCAITLVPQGDHTSGATCLTPLPDDVTTQAVQMTLSENGPWGSDHWLDGWHLNVNYYGYQELPSAYNDEVSAWQTHCSAGYLLRDHNINGPGAYVNANSHGNFPIGGVGNDQLSAVSTFNPC